MKDVACDVESVLQLIRGRWRVLILRELSIESKRHAALKRALRGISQKVLTQCLRDMERANIISRNVYPLARPKVEYSLTPVGRELMNIVMEMHRWCQKRRKLLTRQGALAVRPPQLNPLTSNPKYGKVFTEK